MGIIFTSAFLLPISLIIIFRLFNFRSYLALGIYYLLIFFDALIMQHFIDAGETFRKYYGVTHDLLRVPLLLLFFTYFSPHPLVTKRMLYTGLAFIAYEMLIISIIGYNKDALTLIIGPGLLIILFFSSWFFIRLIKVTINNKKAIGKAIILSSFLFVIGCYGIIYIMHFILRTPETTDVYIMYLISSSVSAVVLSVGLIIENKRIQKLKELLVTRQELRMIYKK